MFSERHPMGELGGMVEDEAFMDEEGFKVWKCEASQQLRENWIKWAQAVQWAITHWAGPRAKARGDTITKYQDGEWSQRLKTTLKRLSITRGKWSEVSVSKGTEGFSTSENTRGLLDTWWSFLWIQERIYTDRERESLPIVGVGWSARKWACCRWSG